MTGSGKAGLEAEVEALLAEATTVLDPEGDRELEAVKLAILVEDAFDVTLTDDEMSLAVLSDPAALTAVVARHARRP